MNALARLDPRGVAALLVLQAGDVVTTIVGLGRGAVESGALARPILGTYGLVGLALIPLIGVAVELVVLAFMPRPFRRAGWTLVLGLSLVPVVSNLIVIAR